MAKKAIVIGAGVVGLATARALATRGYSVKVIERTEKAVGASIRNFGMLWPIGQPDGTLYERAIFSKQIWKQASQEANSWFEESGSLHLAYAADEWTILNELQEIYRHRGYQLLSAAETLEKSSAIVGSNLYGALYSPDEMIIDPRIAIARLPAWLAAKFAVEFIWGKAITSIQYPVAFAGKEEFQADAIYVCSGADFETLYPELFSAQSLTKCKLQMMRVGVQPGGWRMGPSLCAGLSLLHYKAFAAAPSLPLLRQRIESELPDYLKWGIHVMVSQNEAGELTIGDSHEYGLTFDPFDRQFINQLILDYLKGFARFANESVIETWNGVYPKLTNGQTDLVLEPESGVTVINGIGGAGMTLAFGLCEEIIANK